MKEHGSEPQAAEQASSLNLVTVDEIVDRMRDMFEAINQRAYEIFEGNGRAPGQDVENWLRAERELLQRVSAEVAESDANLIVRASVAGFGEKELEVSLEPRRLAISGERDAERESATEGEPGNGMSHNFIFSLFDLPAAVEPETATLTLNDGVLEVEMKKAMAGTAQRQEIRAA